MAGTLRSDHLAPYVGITQIRFGRNFHFPLSPSHELP